MSDRIEGSAAHNAEIQTRAEREMAAIGIDGALIGEVVDTFYMRIREHETLGPVFENRLSDRWAEHMIKMKSFWSAIAFKNGGYAGKPVQAHFGVDGLHEELFKQWLDLFSRTLEDVVPDRQAKEWFMTTATRIARSLTLALFYNPALDDPGIKIKPSPGKTNENTDAI